MPYQLLKDNLKQNLDLSSKELEQICSYFTTKEIKKKEFLLTQGSICKFEGFVVQGCFRVFSLDKNGNDNTLYFAAKDWWLMDIDSFMNQSPSELNIQALEDSKVLLISREDKQTLCNSLPIVEKLFKIMFQKAIVSWQRRLIRNHSLTAKERYLYFINTYPDISLKLTDKQIAGYLGIRHEFLSKIKKSEK
ncbi:MULTISPECIES: Crp/Fnr family transcriptional regulator [Cellulophaga]|uniref:Crp/Fnr family transcriptional regulator n=2 Tax=Cellulophaga TaxID=104264 RepID=A0ABP3B529_9FLAO|nr:MULTISPECIES: Crp/Fnr family transcriptional regulator [Cellulophaga]ADY28556.1 putative transcriptional regulator, Crp/Fnr family [Cellulophaga lytica DSM 7489]EWH12955.1 Crp/Fnr family transcriptional regulator [Cellulophaga geojensis KL-A]WQG77266.1 Crp/Fnr family transcriptional regulator [Cellulophaga lytica]SNQ44769.1 Crp/Fnr-type transcriptional regulator [Cellulophaga lytica]